MYCAMRGIGEGTGPALVDPNSPSQSRSLQEGHNSLSMHTEIEHMAQASKTSVKNTANMLPMVVSWRQGWRAMSQYTSMQLPGRLDGAENLTGVFDPTPHLGHQSSRGAKI